ncbi:hypothetical protein EV368DRAFT_68969 [Lentinula lateritia]|nr:hypothetical protein EV368DRAFT_68969 [Lentinula lateritia]
MYIVNVNNTFGPGVQVIASSQDGRQGYIEVPEPHLQSPERIFFVRLWSDFAKEFDYFSKHLSELHKSINPASQVIAVSTSPDVAPNPALYSLWDGEANSIDNVLNVDYNTTGSGASNLERRAGR